MGAQNAAIGMYDVARFSCTGAQFFDDACVVTVWDKADVLTVGLVRDRQAVFRRQRAGRILGRQMAQRKAQVIKLFRRGREQEIALIAVRILGTKPFRRVRAYIALDLMTGRHAVGF